MALWCICLHLGRVKPQVQRQHLLAALRMPLPTCCPCNLGCQRVWLFWKGKQVTSCVWGQGSTRRTNFHSCQTNNDHHHHHGLDWCKSCPRGKGCLGQNNKQWYPSVLSDSSSIAAICMVVDCTVFLKADGTFHASIYHINDGSSYYYDGVPSQDYEIGFGDGTSIAAITSMESTLVATTTRGVAWKVEYLCAGKFGLIDLV